MEEATPATMSTRSHLLALPPELQLEIFEHLHPVSSACLGLTCKKFYPIHKQLHGVVRLQKTIVFYAPSIEGWRFVRLGALLSIWVGPKFYFHRWMDVRFTKSLDAEEESGKESDDGEDE